MASYGVAITLPLPVSGQVQWDGPLGDLLQAFIDVLAQRVTVDGLDIGAALDMQGHALVNALNVQCIPSGDPGVANSLYYGTGGELFVRDGSNRAIQLTSGGVVNVAGSGGFGGDYVSSNQNGASFTNSTNTFTFTVSGGTTYATVEHGEVKIHQGSSANSVGLKASSAMGSSYELVLPDGLPANGGPTLLRVDATGTVQLAASASFTECIDVSRGVSKAGTTAYNGSGQGWGIGGVGQSGFVDFGIDHQLGDRIDSISFGTSGAGSITASLSFRSETEVNQNGGHQVARVCFNDGTTALHTMQNGTATLTGTLPYTSPGTGSLCLTMGCGGNDIYYMGTLKVVRTRKLIS
jgi:hypothetical protein